MESQVTVVVGEIEAHHGDGVERVGSEEMAPSREVKSKTSL